MRVSIGCDPICRTVGQGVPGARLDRRHKCARPCAAGQPGPRRMVWAFCAQSWSACPCRLDHSPSDSATATVASPNPKTESAASLRMGVCKHVIARSCWGNAGRGGEFPSRLPDAAECQMRRNGGGSRGAAVLCRSADCAQPLRRRSLLARQLEGGKPNRPALRYNCAR